MAKEIFGIELEVPLKQGVTIDQFRECLISAIGSNLVHQPSHGRLVGYHSEEYNSNIDKWRVASDGSLSGFRGRGVEIVSRRRTTLNETRLAMEATRHLVDLDLMTRTSCGGHHVHIGALHFSAMKRTYKPEKAENCTRYRGGACGSRNCSDCGDIQKLIRTKRVKLFEIKVHEIYAYFQPVIDALVSPSRRSSRNNTYCQPVSASYLQVMNNPEGRTSELQKEYLNSKERAAPFRGNRGNVNFGNIGTFGTVEYRQHQQTYNVATVQNWVKLMHRLNSRAWVQESKNINPENFMVSVDGFADFLGLGGTRLRAWMRRRAKHFGYTAIARDMGVNPTVGSTLRQNNRAGNEFRSAIGAMSDYIERRRVIPSVSESENKLLMIQELLLQIENHQNLSEDINDYRILGDDITMDLVGHEIRSRCENWLFNTSFQESSWFTESRWLSLDWENIASMIQNHEVL